MNKIYAKIMAIVLAVSMFLSTSTDFVYAKMDENYFITESSINFASYFPKEINDFAKNNYQDIIQCAREYKIYFNLSDDDFVDIRIGEPFIIYDINDIEQQGIYYYPLIGANNQYIFLITIIDTNHSLQYSLGNDFVDELNRIDYYNTDYVFYKNDDKIIAQSNTDIFCLTNNEKILNSQINYYDVLDDIICSINIFNEIIVEENIDNSGISSLEGYSRSFATNIEKDGNTTRFLQLYNAQGQYEYSMCWAASVATIVNYVYGYNVTAMRVCDVMHIGYNEGAYINQKRQALLKYGLDYKKKGTVMTWQEIKANIDKMMPIAISASSAKGMHAVTLIGYRNVQFNNYIAIWDSALNDGRGAMKIISYSGRYTTFKSDPSEPAYTWIDSLYYYSF